MVSELSARLLKGYSVSYTTSKPLEARESSFSGFSSASSSNSDPDSRISPSDDTTRSSSDRSNTYTMINSNNDGRINGRRDACFKRRKIDELRFAASRVKEDLEKGGLPFPSIHTSRPRFLEGFDIDMSGIHLLGAKSVSDSPFLTKIVGKRTFDSMTEVDQLFAETRKMYSEQWTSEVGIDWEKSSTGSLTSDSEASCETDVPPFMEDDGLKHRPANLKTVSMTTALENSSEPRLVALSFAPFMIIHVNSAYTRMTGLAAKDVLGKPFHQVFQDKRCKTMAAHVTSLAHMQDQLTSVSTTSQDKECYCKLNVSLVGSEIEMEQSLPATHCMVAFDAPEAENQSLNQQPIAAVLSQSDSLHCEVVA